MDIGVLAGIRDAYALYRDGGLRQLGRVGASYAVLQSPLASPVSRAAYWTVAPLYYRYGVRPDSGDRAQPLDPFKVERVSPDRIRRLTRRCYPPWWNRSNLFSAVRDGDWDRRPHDEAPTFSGPPQELFIAETLEESLLYRSLERHFEDGIAWAETDFVNAVVRLLDDGVDHVWHDCDDREDVLQRCRRLDSIYRNMRELGCLSYRERTRPCEREIRFIPALEREIIVDIGRDGELLLVSGKHRLFLAKILGLESVPVVFLVRHAEWIRKRRSPRDCPRLREDHPDLPSRS